LYFFYKKENGLQFKNNFAKLIIKMCDENPKTYNLEKKKVEKWLKKINKKMSNSCQKVVKKCQKVVKKLLKSRQKVAKRPL
jgi:ElaB/YqjD/DUF883 family membrane-anchored ribosome-binding protein